MAVEGISCGIKNLKKLLQGKGQPGGKPVPLATYLKNSAKYQILSGNCRNIGYQCKAVENARKVEKVAKKAFEQAESTLTNEGRKATASRRNEGSEKKGSKKGKKGSKKKDSKKKTSKKKGSKEKGSKKKGSKKKGSKEKGSKKK